MPAPRCPACGYILIGLPVGICPECGRPFDINDPTTYTTKPLFNRFQFWLPGFILALGTGAILYPLCVYATGFGWAVTLVLPLCLGTLIGFSCRVRILNLVLLAIIVLAGLLIGLFSLQIVGVFCGIVLGLVALGPLMVGTFLGWILRTSLKSSNWEQRWHLPTLMALLLLPLLVAIIERFVATPPVSESVATAMVLPVSIDHAWESLMFYEEVRGTPPLLMRFALPHPIYTSGSTGRVGDTKTCVYSEGRLVKRVTGRRAPRELDFDVIEQTKIANRSVTLQGGSFRFEPLASDRTLVTLTTTYRPLLRPRWAWRWSEAIGMHTLHRYVLQGMESKSFEATLSPPVASGNQP